MSGLRLVVEGPERLRVGIFACNLSKIGAPLLNRVIYCYGVGNRTISQSVRTGYLQQIKARDIGGERYVDHLTLEGNLFYYSPPFVQHATEGTPLVLGDGSTPCFRVSIGTRVEGVRTFRNEQLAPSGQGSYAPTSSGAWGTQTTLPPTMVERAGPPWWSSNGQCFSDLSVSSTEIKFNVLHTSYAIYGSGSWIYSASGFRRKWSVHVVWEGGNQWRVTARNVVSERPLSRCPTVTWSLADNLPIDSYTVVSYEIDAQSLEAGFVHPPRTLDNFIAELYREVDAEGVAREALDKYRVVHSNSIENAVQLREGLRNLFPMEAARQAFLAQSTSNKIDKASRYVAALSSLYLWYRYVVKTSFNDIEEWQKAITEGAEAFSRATDSPRRLRKQKKGTRMYAGYELQTRVAELLSVTPYPWLGLLNKALALGFEPGLGQFWDLIPMSFVEDWFTRRGDALRAIDWFFYQKLLRLNVRVSSQRVWYDGPFEADGWVSGRILLARYIRVPKTDYPSLQELLPPPRCVPLKNWAPAAAALALAR